MQFQPGDYCRYIDAFIIVKAVKGDNIITDTMQIVPRDAVVRISRDPARMLRYLKSVGCWSPMLESLYDSLGYMPHENWPNIWHNIVKIVTQDNMATDKIISIFSDKELIPDGQV